MLVCGTGDKFGGLEGQLEKSLERWKVTERKQITDEGPASMHCDVPRAERSRAVN